MIPWIQVYTNVGCHPKTARLAELLEIKCGTVQPAVVAVGVLVSIWSWAAQNAVDGDLGGALPSVLADACRWKKSPQKLWDALVSSGYLDPDGKLHDWDEYHVLLMDAEARRKEKSRERSLRYRQRKEAQRHACVTVTSVTRHAPTIPDQTGQDKDRNGERNDDDHDDTSSLSSRVREEENGGRQVAAPTGAEENGGRQVAAPTGAEVDATVSAAIKRRWGRDADERDLERGRREMMYFDADSGQLRGFDAALIDYVFSVSERAGEKAQNWRFVEGVMRKLRERGIVTVEDALEFDERRG